MSYNPRHAIVRAVRSLPKWARAGILATAASGSIAGLAVAALPSGATVSPTTVYNNTGWAGYYSVPNAHRMSNGDRVTGVRTQFYLRQRAETTAVNLGVELCRPNTMTFPGAAAVLYATWNGTAFDIYANHTFASSSSSTNCLNAMGGTYGKPQYLDTIPAGHTVYLAITQGSHGTVWYTDEDLTNGTGGAYNFGGFTFGFRLGAAGSNAQTSILTEPAINKLAVFHKTSLRDGQQHQNNGWASINRSNLTRMVITKVVDTTTGTSAPPVRLNPVNLQSDGFTLDSGNLSG